MPTTFGDAFAIASAQKDVQSFGALLNTYLDACIANCPKGNVLGGILRSQKDLLQRNPDLSIDDLQKYKTTATDAVTRLGLDEVNLLANPVAYANAVEPKPDVDYTPPTRGM